MIKLLHSADWHLDSPLQGHNPRQTQYLRAELLPYSDKQAVHWLSLAAQKQHVRVLDICRSFHISIRS